MTPADPLKRLLTSRALSRLLLFFALFHHERPHFREIQRRARLGSRSLQRELERLENLGLVERLDAGRNTRYRARTESRAWLPLWQLLSAFADPVEVMTLAVEGLEHVDAAFIYGSIARGDARPDSDVDLFIVGAGIDEIELARRTNEAGALLRRDVNAVIYSLHDLDLAARRGEEYVRRVLGQRKLWVRGDEDLLPTAA